MKKLLLLLLFLLPLVVEAQTNVEYISTTRIIGEGEPKLNKPEKGAHYIDRLTGIVWEKTGAATTSRKWEHETDTLIIKDIVGGVNGKDGAQGPAGQSIVGPQGPAGPAGQSIVGPQGAKGDKGDTGNCSNCPTSIGGIFPFIIVTSNGTDDSQTWQRAIDSAYVNHKPIFAVGNTLFSRGVVVPKNIQNLVIFGGGGEMRAINNTPFTFFAKPLPASVAEAEQVYTFSFIRIQDIVFKGNGQKQIGIDLYAGGGHTYEKILGYSMKSVINLMFSMNARVVSCEAINSVYGFLCISGMGFEEFQGIPGATYANSSPNKATFWSCRTVGSPDQSSKYGFVVNDASGVSINDPTIEGHGFTVAGIYWNSTASTADGAIIVNPHLEPANVWGKGMIYLRSGTSMHNIDGGGTGKAGIVVCVETPGTGYPQIKWSNIGSNKMKFNQGKVFKQAPGASWVFDYVDDPFTDANVLAAFEGSISAGCNGGANKFCIKRVNR